MKPLEQYIKDEIKIKTDVECQFIAFRVIKHISYLVEYIEHTSIRQTPIFHDMIQEQLEDSLGLLTMLSLEYVSDSVYTDEVYSLMIYESNTPSTLNLLPMLSGSNVIIHTMTEILNTMSDKVENEFLVSQLVLTAIKQLYNLIETTGCSIKDMRRNIYNDRKQLLQTTSMLIKGQTTTSIESPFLIDITLYNAKYKGLTLKKGAIVDKKYESGDIVKDFFECTQNLRKYKFDYRYSTRLYEYFNSENTIKQAYIHKGNLESTADMTVEDTNYYHEHQDIFQELYHHVLITQSMTTMDDLLDYLYS